MSAEKSWRAMGRSLKNRNFRLYLAGQGVSHAGMWIQIVAELWLILELTGSGTALGFHSVLRFTPMLVFGVFAGVIGDRVNRRKLLLVTQVLHTLSAGTLAVMVWVATPTLVLIYVIVLIQGVINAIDTPVRRSFIRDLTDDEELSNAVGLHNTIATVARAFGPVISGVLITTFHVQWCFALNALSYLAVLLSLAMINSEKLRPTVPAARGRGQLRAGFRYAWNDIPIRTTLILTFVMAVFAWQWNVILPVYATVEFGGDASLFGVFVSVLSVGSVLGALYTARLSRLGGHHLRVAGGALAMALAVGAVAPTLTVAFAGMALLGAAGSAFNIGAQSRLQLAVDDEMTTRIMALFSVGFAGGKPIGGILAGLLMDASTSRIAFAVGSFALAAATLFYVLIRGRRGDEREPPGPKTSAVRWPA